MCELSLNIFVAGERITCETGLSVYPATPHPFILSFSYEYVLLFSFPALYSKPGTNMWFQL